MNKRIIAICLSCITLIVMLSGCTKRLAITYVTTNATTLDSGNTNSELTNDSVIESECEAASEDDSVGQTEPVMTTVDFSNDESSLENITTQNNQTTSVNTTTSRDEQTTAEYITTTQQVATTQQPTTKQQATTTQQPTTKQQTTTTQQPTTKQQATTTQQPTTKQQATTTQQPTTQQATTAANETYVNCGYYINDAFVNKLRNAYTTDDSSSLNYSEKIFYTKLKQALDSAKNCTRDVDKEKAVHDWIVLNTRYDIENYENNTIPESSYSADGVFTYGVAVCDGYQKAFMLCMRILGIECYTVTGTGKGGSHAWNVIKIGGEWYQIDLTWDDPVPDTPGRVYYDYFNVTDAIMKRDHSYTCQYACTATTYSYFNIYNTAPFIATEDDLTQAIANCDSSATILNAYFTIPFLEHFKLCYECTTIIESKFADYRGGQYFPDTRLINGVEYYSCSLLFK